MIAGTTPIARSQPSPTKISITSSFWMLSIGAAPRSRRIPRLQRDLYAFSADLHSSISAGSFSDDDRIKRSNQSVAPGCPTAIGKRGGSSEFSGSPNPGCAVVITVRLEKARNDRMLTPEQAVLAAMATCVAGAGLTLAVARYKVLAGCFHSPPRPELRF